MSAANVKGATVDVFVNGLDGDSSVTIYCEHTTDTQWLCPFCLSYTMPPEEGATCHRKDGCDCHSAAAKMDALKRARNAVSAAIRKLEEEDGE